MKTLNIFLEITMYSGILFIAIMLLKMCFKNRMSPFMHFAIWGLLIVRLLVPVTLESSVHLFVIPTRSSSGIVQQTQTLKNSTDPILQTNTFKSKQSQPQVNAGGQIQNTANSPMLTGNTIAVRQTAHLSTEEILLAVWLTGACIGILYLVVLYGVLRRRIQKNAQPPSKHLLKLFDEVKAELNINRGVRIIGQCEYGTPAVLFPNIVLMPVGTVVPMSDNEVKFVLRHELMHFKRCDHIMGILMSLLNAIYWFNPIVWLAFKQMHADMETACDSDVVRHLSGKEKTAYAALVLSLFSRKQYRNLALGMARGNNRQIAERRIRGIFMNDKTNKKVKITVILLTALLLFTCFTTACQPTPTTPPVVHKVEDIPKGAILKTGAPPTAEVINSIEPAAYSLKEHWTETVKKNDFLSVEVDADILMPKAAAYPVERLERVVLTKENVDKLIAYFTKPGTRFYTGGDVMLKSDYEKELIELKQSLQNVLKGGDGEDPDSIRSYIKEVERKLAKAPESHTYTYINPVFTYSTDAETGEPRKEDGENNISVSIESPDGGRYGSISASRYEKGKNTDSSFYYSNISGGWNTESYFTGYDKELKQEMADPRYAQTNDEEKKDMTKQRKFVDAGLKSMMENKMDLRAAADRAVRVLEELGIKGMQLKSYEKAMFSRESGQEVGTIPGCYVEFVRECGGIPSLSQSGGSFSTKQDYSELYCAPFSPERVNLLISENGVENFSWSGMAQVVGRVAENTTLLPLDQIKQRILNHVCFMDGGWLDGKRGKMRVKIPEIRLVTTYINAKDDPERVLIVPAWHIMAQEECLFDKTNVWRQGNKEEYMINALDGSGILMPGILERMKERQG